MLHEVYCFTSSSMLNMHPEMQKSSLVDLCNGLLNVTTGQKEYKIRFLV